QFLMELREQIAEAQLDGLPLERVAFNEVDQALEVLPSLEREPLFWSSVIELLNTQGITSFFFLDTTEEDALVRAFRASVDYSVSTFGVAEFEKTPSDFPPPRHEEIQR